LATRHRDFRIVAFVCEWHPLASADNAGADGCTYGTGTTVVPVECAGTVTSAAILRALTRGADGVLIAACGSGDCHYSNGNESCERIVEETHALMKISGLSPERLKLDLSSEVEGQRFADMVSDFASELAELGGRARGRKPRTGRPRQSAKSRRASGARRTARQG
jgi:coenzyme F420-reducing hydrogenase delta subunit